MKNHWIILVAIFYVILGIPKLYAGLSEEQFKKGYIAYDIIKGEVMLLDFMVNQCKNHNIELGNQINSKYVSWRKTNKEMFEKLKQYRKLMLEKLKREGMTAEQINQIFAQEKDRMDQRLKKPRDTFLTAEPNVIYAICNSMNTKFSSGIVKMQSVRPEHYKDLMSLNIK